MKPALNNYIMCRKTDRMDLVRDEISVPDREEETSAGNIPTIQKNPAYEDHEINTDGQ